MSKAKAELNKEIVMLGSEGLLTEISIQKNGLCEGCAMADLEINELVGYWYVKCEHENACNRAYDLGLHDGLKRKNKQVDEVTE